MKYLFSKTIALFFVLLMAVSAQSQVSTNVDALKKLAREQEKEWKQKKKRVDQYAKEQNIEIRTEYPSGTIIELIDVIDGQPIYYKTDNLGAAITTRANQLWQGGSVGVVIDGEGYSKVGIWDGGAVRLTHQEFNNTGVPRVSMGDNTTSQSAHSTHVAGTIVAGGVVANAKGMAHKGNLKSYNWTSVEAEMSTAALNGMEISNHSWGTVRGWNQNETTGAWSWAGTTSVAPLEDYQFGFYNSQSRTWDIIAYNAPYFLITKSAGNDRGDGPSNAGTGDNPEKDGGIDGYDCIGGSGVSKNIITVGAVNEVLNYTGPQNVVMSSFSSWGPADDGRIKPDIVAKGVGVYSSISSSNTAYATYQGTSMSAPNAAGSMVLLQQLYQQTHASTPMRSSTLKGLVIHTADEAGVTVGPDYKFGWGLMNTERAANIIIEDGAVQNSIDEITLVNGTPFIREITATGGGTPLRVTICWTDPNGNMPPASLNPRTAVIINDLDLRILDGSGAVYYPYKLDPDNPSAAATTDSKNLVDNVEQVYIETPTAGTYTIMVDNAGTLSANQVFSLIISGIDEFASVPECSTGMIDPVVGFTEAFLNHKVTWAEANFATSYDVYFGTDGGGTSLPTNVMNGENMTDNYFRRNLEPLTTYYLAVKPRNSFGVNDCQTIYSFSTMGVTNQYPYFQGAESVTAPALPTNWSAMDYGNMTWATTSLIGFTGSKAFAIYTTNGQTTPLNNWLVSPPMAVQTGKEYRVSFAYRCFNPSVPESLRVVWGPHADTNLMTNIILDNPAFNDQNWLTANGLIVPEIDGYIFFAWHANTANGMGQFMDDVKIEDWGTVGIADSPERKISVYNNNGIISIESEFVLEQVELTIVNASGQTLLSEKVSGVRSIEKSIELTSGVYIVSLKGKGFEKNTKLFIN